MSNSPEEAAAVLTEAEPPDAEVPLRWPRPLRTGVWVWALAVGLLLVGRYGIGPFLPFVADNLKAVAVVAFLYLPVWLTGRKGELLADYGLTLVHWRRDLAWAFGTILVVYPLFILLFWGFVEILPLVPQPLAGWLAPYRGLPEPAFRLPADVGLLLGTHLLVVALPEELFYRGFLWARLSEGLGEGGPGPRILGVTLGPAMLLTATLFALGHLTEPYVWRLAVFFPALLFGWLRVRSGGLLAPILVHGFANVFMATLEVSFFGP